MVPVAGPSLSLAVIVSVLCHDVSWSFAVAPARKPPQPATTALLANPPTTSDDDDDASSIRDSWNLLVLGDLHMEEDMSSHEQAREDCVDALRELSLLLPRQHSSSTTTTLAEVIPTLEDRRAGDLSEGQLELLLETRRAKRRRRQHGHGGGEPLLNSHLVSLGDLGRGSKEIRHEPGDPGTTKCFRDAKAYLDGFEGIDGYELVSGNHDLEGLDEFDTDEDNLRAWMDVFGKPTPQFYRRIGERTVLLGVSTVRFRDAPHSPHEVHINDAQLEWFVDTVRRHPADEGWKILVFSHAPVMGSGLRVVQDVHVNSGVAWLNHCSEDSRRLFIRTVRDNPQIKMWFSGHFHLSHDYEDSISRVGSCAFVQVGVVGPASSRDGRRQTRLVQGCTDRIRVYSVNHHLRDDDGKADVRLDFDIDLVNDEVTFAHGYDDVDNQEWFQAYTPREEDGCYIEAPNGSVADASSLDDGKVCWWHMKCGRVIGLHNAQVVEYDAETLSPLGIVVDREKLRGREVVVVNEGATLVLVDDDSQQMKVIHPNDDGSYWRPRRVLQSETEREEAAKEAIARLRRQNIR